MMGVEVGTNNCNFNYGECYELKNGFILYPKNKTVYEFPLWMP